MNIQHSQTAKVTVLIIFFLIISIFMSGMSCGGMLDRSVSLTASAAGYTEKTITVDHEGQVVDSFYGIDAMYVTTYSDVGEYSCAGYVSRFYSELFGVTVYNINIIDDKPDVYCWGKNVELRAVETPQPGDIMQDKDYSHVAIVKSCSGDEVTIIEQNYKWSSGTGDDRTVYTVVNRKLIKDRHYYYRLYIDGKVQSLPGTTPAEEADKTAPVISNMAASSVTSSGFTASASITDNKAVSKVKVGITVPNGTTTYKTYTNLSSNFKYVLKIADFGGTSGTYTVAFTAYDAAGNYTAKSVKKYIDADSPVISSLKAENINAKGFDVSTKAVDVGGISKVTFEVTPVSGSSYKKTYTAKLSGSTASYSVLLANHNGIAGTYKIKATAVDKFGNTSSKTIQINVNPAKSVKLDTSSCSVAKGSSKTIKAAMTGSVTGTITDSVVWKSSNTSVATVKDGKITSKALGTAKISATTTGGKVATCNVKVTSPISKASAASIPDRTYNGSAHKPAVTITLDGKKLSSTNDYNVAYSNNVSTGTATVKLTGKGYYTGSKTVTFRIIPAQVKNLKTTVVLDNELRISWSAVSGADGYEVYRYNSSTAKWDKIRTTSALKFVDSKLSGGTVYKYKVRAYRLYDGKSVFGSYSSTLSEKTLPAKTTMTASSAKSGSISASWKALNGVSSYEIYISSTGKEGSFTKLTEVKDTSCTVSGLPKTCLRFVKVRGAYVLNGEKKVGSFSPVVMVMVK